MKARSFVEDGFRNQTWITVDFGDHTCSVSNVHGVAETTAAAMKGNVPPLLKIFVPFQS